jgi:AraC-like DNA-binding protein
MRRVYSTESVGPAERLAFWNAIASRAIAPMSIEAMGAAPFRAELGRASLGRCELFSPRSTAASVRFDGAVRRRAGVRKRRMLLMLQCEGRSLAQLAGRDVELQPGDSVVIDAEAPYTIGFTEPTRVILASLEGDERRLAAMERVAGHRACGAIGAGALLSSFLRSTWAHLDDQLAEEGGGALSAALWDLAALAYGLPRSAVATGTRADDMRAQMQAFMEERLHDPALGAAMIARDFAVSRRYVQMLFSEIGFTPSAFILERRLERAAERLGQGEDCVTDVAFSLGFNDLSHFSRAFRRRLGVSPRAYRDAARRRAAT